MFCFSHVGLHLFVQLSLLSDLIVELLICLKMEYINPGLPGK